MAMAISQMVWATFITIINMWFTCRDGLRPWVSWAFVHSDFGRVDQFPTLFIAQPIWVFVYAMFWTVPLTALMFFLFFAFGQDAVKEYKACVGVVRRVVHLLEKKAATAQSVQSSAAPAFAPQFLKMDRRSMAVSDTCTDTNTMHSKPAYDDDIPLSPHSLSSTFVPSSYEAPAYDHKFYAPSDHKPDVGHMA
jgi:pheromone a factor receptor